MPPKHIGILTGGGDVPGLNAAILSVYRAMQRRGWTRGAGGDARLTGILRGWHGAVAMGKDSSTGDPGYLLPLTDALVRNVDLTGGTFLHTSRVRPDRMKLKDLPQRLQERKEKLIPVPGKEGVYDVVDVVIRNLQECGIDLLVAIGGDDTLGSAYRLHARGFPVIGIPKTMDNDVQGTEYAIGFKTALTRAEDFINRHRTTLSSHDLVGVFRIFGRDAGFTSLGTAMAVSDIRCAIPEHPFDLDTLCKLVEKDYRHGDARTALVLCSEGAIWKGGKLEEYGAADGYGHRKKMNVGDALAAEITKKTGLGTRAQDITYDLRSGPPDALDKIVANTYGTLAVDLIAEGKMGEMLGIQNGRYTHVPLPDPNRGPRKVDVAALYDVDEFRPKLSGLLGRPVFF
jgi:ATP-dependent phosphofructokinase / diphosphate-dependent phosphofructokinase